MTEVPVAPVRVAIADDQDLVRAGCELVLEGPRLEVVGRRPTVGRRSRWFAELHRTWS